MTQKEMQNSLVKQLELRGMNADFYMDMVNDYVYYWSLKKKLIADIKKKGLAMRPSMETEYMWRKQTNLWSICRKQPQRC